MSVLLRYASLRRLQVVLGLVVVGLVFAPSASGAAQLDTVTATGLSDQGLTDININAQSDTSGRNVSGTASFNFAVVFFVSGSVTCLRVTGPDRGIGTPGSPTTAVLKFRDSTSMSGGSGLGLVTVYLVDTGGSGFDTMAVTALGGSPTDCSNPPIPGFRLLGAADVFDAPVLPTSKAQCKNGGWLNYPQFKNHGQCVRFVVRQARQKCLTERATIGLLAFRNKYGLGRYHVRAMRRCVNQASR